MSVLAAVKKKSTYNIDWVDINNINLVFMILEARKSQIEVLADLVSSENPPPSWLSLHCVLTW